MGFAGFYFERLENFKVKINANAQKDLKYSIVIPCFNEFNIQKTLNSLWDCKRPKSSTEVILVINSADGADKKILDQNTKTYNEVKGWIGNHKDPLLHFFVIHETNLPKKFAGAGLARKIGMDQAVWRFNAISQEEGVIISLDADSIVEENYLLEIERAFEINSKLNAATIYFEHPVHGDDFSADIYEAITTYELYLRYYKLALNFSGFPYSYYTIGSCFAVSVKAYIKQGGMNKKRAGEDFYFLHKIFPLGNVKEINTTTVHPSPRPSDRVPFGTGPMISSIIESESKDFFTYKFDTFLELKYLFSNVAKLYKISIEGLKAFLNELPKCMSDFLIENDIYLNIDEINGNSSSLKSFTKRFYDWFTAFRVIKYLNFAHSTYFDKSHLLKEVKSLLLAMHLEDNVMEGYLEYLYLLRNIERQF